MNGVKAKLRYLPNTFEFLDNGDFILESHGVGKFGRCLGSLHVDDVNINKVLVSEGHANEYYGGKR